MDKKTLRQYQSSAIESLFDWLFKPEKGHPLVVAPVGSGKSLLIAEFIRRCDEMYGRNRIVVLTHVKELLVQNAEELHAHYPEADYGFYCSSLNQKRLHNDITFASIQSVHNKIARFNRCPELIIIDECHLISHNDATQYRKFINSVLAINPNAKVIGFTGTPFRADTGRLDEGKNKLFDGVAYEIPMLYMIEEGFWARPVTPAVKTQMDVDGVKVVKGDYAPGQLEQRIDVDEITQKCVDEIIEHGANRRKWLIFSGGVQHCEHIRDAIRARGVSCEMVTGETPDHERDDIINRYKAGEIRALVNVAVLTTGFNVPDIDMLVFMRPTRSPVLYIQMTGRGIRPVYAPGYDLSTKDGRLEAMATGVKPDLMVLDFGGVIKTLGAIDAVEIRKKFAGESDGTGNAVTKLCPSCGARCAAAQRYCYECSYNFLAKSISETADGHSAMLTIDEPVRTLNVLDVGYFKHFKKDDPDAPPTLKVSYFCYTGVYSEWLCFEHPSGYARDKARHWHKQRLPDVPPPLTIDQAIAISKQYPFPDTIDVRKEGKFNRVLNCDFSGQVEEVNIWDTIDETISF